MCLAEVSLFIHRLISTKCQQDSFNGQNMHPWRAAYGEPVNCVALRFTSIVDESNVMFRQH